MTRAAEPVWRAGTLRVLRALLAPLCALWLAAAAQAAPRGLIVELKDAPPHAEPARDVTFKATGPTPRRCSASVCSGWWPRPAWPARRRRPARRRCVRRAVPRMCWSSAAHCRRPRPRRCWRACGPCPRWPGPSPTIARCCCKARRRAIRSFRAPLASGGCNRRAAATLIRSRRACAACPACSARGRGPPAAYRCRWPCSTPASPSIRSCKARGCPASTSSATRRWPTMATAATSTPPTLATGSPRSSARTSCVRPLRHARQLLARHDRQRHPGRTHRQQPRGRCGRLERAHRAGAGGRQVRRRGGRHHRWHALGGRPDGEQRARLVAAQRQPGARDQPQFRRQQAVQPRLSERDRRAAWARCDGGGGGRQRPGCRDATGQLPWRGRRGGTQSRWLQGPLLELRPRGDAGHRGRRRRQQPAGQPDRRWRPADAVQQRCHRGRRTHLCAQLRHQLRHADRGRRRGADAVGQPRLDGRPGDCRPGGVGASSRAFTLAGVVLGRKLGHLPVQQGHLRRRHARCRAGVVLRARSGRLRVAGTWRRGARQPRTRGGVAGAAAGHPGVARRTRRRCHRRRRARRVVAARAGCGARRPQQTTLRAARSGASASERPCALTAAPRKAGSPSRRAAG